MTTYAKRLGQVQVFSGLGVVALMGVLTGCSVNRVGLVGNPAIQRHFAQGQVTDVTLTLKQVGDSKGITGRHPVKQSFLEGFIEGSLTEWDGTPAPGVTVRVDWEGWANPSPTSLEEEDRPEPGQPITATLTSDEDDPRATVLVDARGGTAITEKDGRYRVPFALPLRNGKVEASGRLFFSPDWGTLMDKTGYAYEPFTEEVPFQLFYDHKEQLLAYNQGYHRNAIRLRRATLSETPAPVKTKSKGNDNSILTTLWLDLQLTLVNHRLEKQVALSKTDNTVLLSLPEPEIFNENKSTLTKAGQDLLPPIAQWITDKRCRLNVQVTPGQDPDLAKRRAQEMKSALLRAGIPQARFIINAENNPSTGVTLCLYP